MLLVLITFVFGHANGDMHDKKLKGGRNIQMATISWTVQISKTCITIIKTFDFISGVAKNFT